MAEDSELTRTRLDVAEMKGMLGQALLSFDTRLSDHERRLDAHEVRLDDKGKLIARLDEQVRDVDGDISELKADNSSRHGRWLGTAGLVVSILVAALAIYNRITLS